MPRPNWFLAFPLDGRFVLELPELPAGFRRFHPDDVHLTLAFLGGCGEEKAHLALAELERRLDASPLYALTVSLAEVVPMGGSRRNYTALSALLGQGRSEAVAAIAQFRDPLTEIAGGRRERRAPKPHVTFARPGRRASEAERESGLAWAQARDLTHVTARLDRVALYTWSESRRERNFRIVVERPLT